MKHRYRWLVIAVMMIAGLQLAACTPEAAAPTKIEPAEVEPLGEVDGVELQRLILTEKAAERLGIQTVPVREEQVVRKQTVPGEIVALPGSSAMTTVTDSGTISGSEVGGDIWVRVSFTEGELDELDGDQPALVKPLRDEDEADGWTARAEGISEANDTEDDDSDQEGQESEEENGVLYYKVEGDEPNLEPGQTVFVEVSLAGSDTMTKVIPYAALIYDVEGGNWVYVKEPDALAFVRERVTVDYIEGDQVFLTDGPPLGTEIVTVGVSELYGLETGVSK